MNRIQLNTIGDSPVVVKKGSQVQSQEKTVEITENGTTEVVPDAGYALSKVIVNTNVESSGSDDLEYLDLSGLSGDALIDILTTFAVFFKGTVGGAKMYGTIGLLINQDYTLEALAINFTAPIYSESIGIITVSQAVEMYGLTSEQLAAIPRITKEEFYSLSEFVSIRDLYQPTTSDVDISTGYFDGVTNCDKVTEIQVIGPTVYEDGLELYVSFLNASKNTFAQLGIYTNDIDTRIVWNRETATDGISSGVIYTITPDNVVTRNDEEIDKFNAILAGDDFRYAIANMGVGFTEAQFDTLDKYIKVKKG